MKKKPASIETETQDKKGKDNKQKKITINDLHSFKSKRLLGEYNYRDLIVFFTTVILAPLGLMSFIKNLYFSVIEGGFSNIFNMVASISVLLCFTVYYFLLGFKIKLKQIPALSFTIYSLCFFIGADKGYSMSYLLMFFSSMLIIFSANNYRSSINLELLYLWINVVIFISKSVFSFPTWLHFNDTDNFAIGIPIACLISSAGVLIICYILFNEIYEHFYIKKELVKNTLSEQEKVMAFMILLNYDKSTICDMLGISSSTFDNHSASIRKKLGIYGTLSRDLIRKKLYGPDSNESGQH